MPTDEESQTKGSDCHSDAKLCFECLVTGRIDSRANVNGEREQAELRCNDTFLRNRPIHRIGRTTETT